MGCEIRQIALKQDAFYGWWRLYTWAEDQQGHRWCRLYSVREKRSQALEDCDHWLDCVLAVHKQQNKNSAH